MPRSTALGRRVGRADAADCGQVNALLLPDRGDELVTPLALKELLRQRDIAQERACHRAHPGTKTPTVGATEGADPHRLTPRGRSSR